ncbi:prepilin peptidase, partial [Citrobacter amalonaticus]|uniref:prepilin peptidase n=1 Tax=Citrobacter amalonaticus TaxID=35703 RepID=UPI002160670F
MILLQRGLIVLIALQLIYCCYTDIFERKIKNKVVFSILLLSLLLSFAVQDINIKFPLSIMFVGFFINLLGVIGAGDVKLIASLSFSIPVSQFI